MKRPSSRLFNSNNTATIGSIVFDSLIIGGFTFLSTLGNAMPTSEELFIAAKVAGISFFAQVIYEKGIKKPKQQAAKKK